MHIVTRVLAAIAFATVAVNPLQAQEAVTEHAALKSRIQEVAGLKVLAISPAPVAGLLQILTQRGLFYVSEDGKYFIQGVVYNTADGMKNMTEVALSATRLDGVKRLAKDAIEFKAEKEKYAVTVFTDTSCGYCRKLHDEMSEYNRLGITVNYLAFPRSGPGSPNFVEMESLWCASDKQQAMTLAKAGKKIDQVSCVNSVRQQYEFGQQAGVTGTPAIVLPDGAIMPGYLPAEKLESVLKNAGSNG